MVVKTLQFTPFRRAMPFGVPDAGWHQLREPTERCWHLKRACHGSSIRISSSAVTREGRDSWYQRSQQLTKPLESDANGKVQRITYLFGFKLLEENSGQFNTYLWRSLHRFPSMLFLLHSSEPRTKQDLPCNCTSCCQYKLMTQTEEFVH